MKPRVNFITLAVEDLERSVFFYRQLGMPTKGIQEGNEEHCLFELENNFSLVLYRKKEFQEITGKRDAGETSSGFILSHIAESKGQVDETLETALKAGGKQVGKIEDAPWGYSANFLDPDGHQWEVVCMHRY